MQLPMPLSLTTFAYDDEEHRLIEAAKQDKQAFATLYRRHHSVIAGYVFRRVGDLHATDDLVADVFLAALRTLPRYRHRGLPIRAWLYRIAANRVNRWAKRERSRIHLRFSELQHIDQPDKKSETPDTGDRDGEFARIALLSIKPKYQTVLSLHYLEGMSIEDVAAAVGCRVGTVKSRLSRGRDALREKLARRR